MANQFEIVVIGSINLDLVLRVAHPPLPGETVVTKQYASAFFGTSLVTQLNMLRVDSLIVAGCTTSGCVRATVMDAFSYGYKATVVEECVYDRSRLSHEVGLFGSESWLRAHVDDVSRIAAVINFDGHGLVGGDQTASLLGGAEWVSLSDAVLAATGVPVAIRYEAAGGVGVDSVNFAALGRNAINFGNGGAPRAHTPADSLAPLGPTGLAGALRMGAALLAATANRDDHDLALPPPAAQVRETQSYCARWGWGIAE